MTAPRAPGHVAFVSLGSNLGDRRAVMRAAVNALGRLPATQLVDVSSLYRTPPWGDTAQDDFVNAVVQLETVLEPRDLLTRLLAIETQLGRRRDAERRWGPRVIDLDLLLYDDSSFSVPGMDVPHARLHERAFVLVPLLDLAPETMIPGHGHAQDLLASLDQEGIEQIEARDWATN